MIYSYTQLSHYLACPRKYRYRYLDGWHEKETRAGLLFDVRSGRVLWQLHHHLYDLSYLPSWDAETREIWDDYREVNRMVAQGLDAEGDRDPVYLVQDYHLSLVPALLRQLQPNARIAHFTHTPFAGQSFDRTVHRGDLTGIEIMGRLRDALFAARVHILEEVL